MSLFDDMKNYKSGALSKEDFDKKQKARYNQSEIANTLLKTPTQKLGEAKELNKRAEENSPYKEMSRYPYAIAPENKNGFWGATWDYAKAAFKDFGQSMQNLGVDLITQSVQSDQYTPDPTLEMAKSFGLTDFSNEKYIEEKKKIASASEQAEKQILQDNQSKSEKRQKEIAESTKHLPKWQQDLSMYIGQTANMVPSVGAGVLTGGAAAMPVLAAQVYGGSLSEAVNEGAELDEARFYGLGSAALELTIEKAFGAIPGFKEGALDDLIQKGVSKLTKNKVASELVSGVIKNVGEGGEEVASLILSPYLKRITFDENAELPKTVDEYYDAFMGGFVGASVFGGGNYLTNKALSSIGKGSSNKKTVSVDKEPSGKITFDDVVNYRTHKVINEMDLIPVSVADADPEAAAAEMASSPSAISIPQTSGNSNSQSVENMKKGQVVAENSGATDMETIKQEYAAAVDEEMVNFAEYAVNNPQDNKSAFQMKPVSQRQAADIQRLTGINATNFGTEAKTNAFRHIGNDHGENGITDHSMADVNDVARMQYVIDNYDSMELLEDASAEFRDKNQNPAPMVKMSKRVNGTYYVVEAVPDTNRKKLEVISAYKKEAAPQTVDVHAPTSNVQNASGYTASAISIPQTSGNSNSQSVESFEKGQAGVRNSGAVRSAGGAQTVGRVSGLDGVRRSAQWKAATKLMDMLSRTAGTKFVVFEGNMWDEGHYDPKTRTAYINKNAERPFSWIVCHEFAHDLKVNDSAAFHALAQWTRNDMNLENFNKYKADLLAAYDRIGAKALGFDYKQMTAQELDELVMEEVVCDMVAEILQDPETIRRMAAQDLTLAEKIVNYLDEFIQKISAALGNSDPEIRALVNNFEETKRVYQAVLENSAKKGSRSEGAPGNVKFSFGGRRAQQADVGTLSKAKRMRRQGADWNQIYRDTGWFTGYDGKWRFEIDDSEMELDYLALNYKLEKWLVDAVEKLRKEEPDLSEAEARQYIQETEDPVLRLGDIIKHPKLFKQYPDLADIKLSFSQDADFDGEYNPKFDMITIYKYVSDLKEILIHELQHAIQEREGFARGSNPKAWKGTEKEKFSQYYHAAGEIEARNASGRIDMTEAERRAGMPIDRSVGVVYAEDAPGYTAGQVRYEVKRDYKHQVDDALDGKLNRGYSVYMGRTPNLLHKCGLSEDLPMLMHQGHLRDMNTAKDSKNVHFHGLSRDIIKQLPEEIKFPVMIYDSISPDNKENTVCVLTSLLDDDGLPIIVAIKANSDGSNKYYDISGETINTKKSNFVASGYGKDGFRYHIEEIIDNNAILYANKKKTLKLFSDIGLQLPERLNNLGFDTIIHQSNNIVNTSLSKNDKNDTTIKRSVSRKARAEDAPYFKENKFSVSREKQAGDSQKSLAENRGDVVEYNQGVDTEIEFVTDKELMYPDDAMQLDNVVMQRQTELKQQGKRFTGVDHVFTNNYFVVYNGKSMGNYEIKYAVWINGNEDFINEIRGKGGDVNVNRESGIPVEMFTNFRRRRGRNNRDYDSGKTSRTYGGDDKLFGSTSKSNSRGTAFASQADTDGRKRIEYTFDDGDDGVKYSVSRKARVESENSLDENGGDAVEYVEYNQGIDTEIEFVTDKELMYPDDAMQLDNVVMQRQTELKQQGKRFTGEQFAYTNDYFVVFNSRGMGEYDLLYAIWVDGNEDAVDFVRSGLENGKIYRGAQGIGTVLSNYWNGRGWDSWNYNSIEKPKTRRANAGLSVRTSGRDGAGRSKGSQADTDGRKRIEYTFDDGDDGVKYSVSRKARAENAMQKYQETGDVRDLPDRAWSNSFLRDSRNKSRYLLNQMLGLEYELEFADEASKNAIENAISKLRDKITAAGENEVAAGALRDLLDNVTLSRNVNLAPIISYLVDVDGVKNGSYRFNDLYRNFERFFGQHFYIAKPLLDGWDGAKGDYSRMVEELRFDMWQHIVKELGIKKGSKESKAVQWIAEKQRNPLTKEEIRKINDIVLEETKARGLTKKQAADMKKTLRVDYTEEMLYREFGKEKAERILKAEKWFREQYDKLIDEINKILAIMYPGRPDKQIQKRADYMRHFREIQTGFAGLRNIAEMDNNISPALVLVSDHTRPKEKWASIKQTRTVGATDEGAIEGFLDYLPQAAYAIYIDPYIDQFRGLARDISELKQKNNDTSANTFIKYLNDFANHIAGKTDILDRPVNDFSSKGRKRVKMINWFNNRTKANAVLGNIASVTKQVMNIPNGVKLLDNPVHIFQGVKDVLASMEKDGEARKNYKKSDFLTERFLDKSFSMFDKNGLTKGAQWLLSAADEFGTRVIWNSAYREGAALSKAGQIQDTPERYADILTRKAVAGRGVGEVPLAYQSQIGKLMLPFQIEVSNSWNVDRDVLAGRAGKDAPMSKNHRAFNMTVGYLATWALGAALEALVGSAGSFNPLDDIFDGIMQGFKEKEDEDPFERILQGGKRAGQNLAGDFIGNRSFGWIAGEFLNMIDEDWATNFFNDRVYASQGVNVPAVQSAAKAIKKATSGDGVGAAAEAVSSFLLPFGGKQLDKTVRGVSDFAKGGKYENDIYKELSTGERGNLQYEIEQTPGNFFKSALFGPSAVKAGQNYWDAKDLETYKKSELSKEEKKQQREFVKEYDKSHSGGEVEKLYDEIKDFSVYPFSPVKAEQTFTRDNKKYSFSLLPAEQKAYQEEQNQLMEEEYQKVLATPAYKNGDAETKKSLLEDARKEAERTIRELMQNEYLYKDKGEYGRFLAEGEHIKRTSEGTEKARASELLSYAKAMEKDGKVTKAVASGFQKELGKKRSETALDKELVRLEEAGTGVSVMGNAATLFEFSKNKIDYVIPVPSSAVVSVYVNTEERIRNAMSRVIASAAYKNATVDKKKDMLSAAKSDVRAEVREELKRKYGSKVDDDFAKIMRMK